MNNIIFLDFDGVLNSHSWLLEANKIQSSNDSKYLNIENIDNLNYILLKTEINTKIVISSSWKHRYETIAELQNILYEAGCIGEVIGITPNNGEYESGLLTTSYERKHEIQAYFNHHKNEINNIVVLDDCRVFEPHDGFYKYFINTNGNFGLTKNDALEAVKILNK